MQDINISAYAIPGVEKGLPHKAEVIIKSVCDYFQITRENIKGRNRKRDVVTARHIAMYLLRNKTDLTLLNIGKKLYRDHTSVIHAMRKINDFIYINDEETMIALNTIKDNLNFKSE